MSFTLQFIDEGNGKVSIKEHFIDLKSVCTSTREGLFEVLLNTLKENNIKK